MRQELVGGPLHPTPVYSILCNAFVALVITRLWLLHAPLHLIAGLYFILTGLGRFVEEAWRGEPQTPVLAGLRLYQWAAAASVVAGVLMTALGRSEPAPFARFDWSVMLPSAAFGLLVWCAMGVDFPESNRRLSNAAATSAVAADSAFRPCLLPSMAMPVVICTSACRALEKWRPAWPAVIGFVEGVISSYR